MRRTLQTAAPFFLVCLSVLISLQGCASLEPSPRFRTSSISFAPDQLPLAQRSTADLADPAVVADYTALKAQGSSHRNLGADTEDVRSMIVNQSSASTTVYADEVGLDVEEIEDELGVGEDFSADEPPAQEAAIEEIMQRSYASSVDQVREINPAVNRAELIREIVNLLGIRYRYGGTDATRGLDCSAFTGTIYSRALGVRLPRSSNQQFGVGRNVKREELKVGDLVFFKTRRRRGPVSHVGIYVGEELFAHASTKHGVIISSLEHPFYHKTFVGAKRVLQTEYTDAENRR